MMRMMAETVHIRRLVYIYLCNKIFKYFTYNRRCMECMEEGVFKLDFISQMFLH